MQSRQLPSAPPVGMRTHRKHPALGLGTKPRTWGSAAALVCSGFGGRRKTEARTSARPTGLEEAQDQVLGVCGTHQFPCKEVNRPGTLQPGTQTGYSRGVHRLPGRIDKESKGHHSPFRGTG